MPSRLRHARSLMEAALCALALLATPAEAGHWGVSAGGGLVGGYRPNGDGSVLYPTVSADEFTSTWLSFLAVERAVNRTLWIRTEVSHFAYDTPAPRYYGYLGLARAAALTGAQTAAAGEPDGRRTVRFVPVALGFRWQGIPGKSGVAPYLEFLPTLFVVHWNEDYTATIYQFPDTVLSLVGHRAFTRGVAGFSTGLGLHIVASERWALDYGIQYRYSADLHRDWRVIPSTLYPARLRGLGNLALAVGLSWKP